MEPVSQCLVCKHLNDATVAGRMTCAAFPGGIPTPILANDFDHRKAHPRDGGTRWKATVEDGEAAQHPFEANGLPDDALA